MKTITSLQRLNSNMSIPFNSKGSYNLTWVVKHFITCMGNDLDHALDVSHPDEFNRGIYRHLRFYCKKYRVHMNVFRNIDQHQISPVPERMKLCNPAKTSSAPKLKPTVGEVIEFILEFEYGSAKSSKDYKFFVYFYGKVTHIDQKYIAVDPVHSLDLSLKTDSFSILNNNINNYFDISSSNQDSLEDKMLSPEEKQKIAHQENLDAACKLETDVLMGIIDSRIAESNREKEQGIIHEINKEEAKKEIEELFLDDPLELISPLVTSEENQKEEQQEQDSFSDEELKRLFT